MRSAAGARQVKNHFFPLRQVAFAGLPRLRSNLAHAITKSFLSGYRAVIWIAIGLGAWVLSPGGYSLSLVHFRPRSEISTGKRRLRLEPSVHRCTRFPSRHADFSGEILLDC
jgi:hypothetical protein